MKEEIKEMIEYDELYKEVKKRLSDKRFAHSECVVKRAIEYAEIYHADINMVKLVAISHDIAKELTDEEIKENIEKYKIELDAVEKENPNLIHAKIGAYICKENYKCTHKYTFKTVRHKRSPIFRFYIKCSENDKRQYYTNIHANHNSGKSC